MKRPIRLKYRHLKPNKLKGVYRHCLLTDEELLQAFAGPENQSEIAKRAGVSRERIRQIYNARFRDQLGGLSGVGRNRLNWEEKHFPGLEASWSPATRRVAATARENDMEVFPVPVIPRTKGRGHSHLLVINGRSCLVRTARSHYVPKVGGRRYYHFGIRRVKDDFTIFVTRVRIFVVPNTMLRDRYSHHLYLPVDKLPPYNNIQPGVDWWQYENAWELLR